MPPPFQIQPAQSTEVHPSIMERNVIITRLDQRGPLFYAEIDTGKLVAGVIIGYAIVPVEKWDEAYRALLAQKERERRPWYRRLF